MYCITRKEMKFGEYVIPARTKCDLVNILKTTTVDAPGVQLTIKVSLLDIKYNTELLSEIQKKDEYDSGYNTATLSGIVIWTNTENVYMDAGDLLYKDYNLYDWQLERIFDNDNTLKNLFISMHKYNKNETSLEDIIEYFDNEFAEWVGSNCNFITLTEENVEDYGDFEIGDSVLSENGLEQFFKKQLEYQNKLESIGFTYDFKGGLNWN